MNLKDYNLCKTLLQYDIIKHRKDYNRDNELTIEKQNNYLESLIHKNKELTNKLNNIKKLF